ncbi:hypothetical protein [Polyangium mundeleinium]|uniref:Uncharacterized protein n=1 Tax=Polyangium mundeleinium TaxID=2995306 RepID=A0ABT5F2N3_9BACT|nr:hypothetical protein [Polyangium mundeleinium]MDC0747742.1 hypothetical protein [Polyangium mundeleinium]
MIIGLLLFRGQACESTGSACADRSPVGRGRSLVARLREKLPHLSYERVILPALIRLEEQGVVALVQTRTGDPMAEILREGVTHVELRVPV